MFQKYFSTLRGTFLFMISFGLFMGVVFPFYSSIFFGTKAFTPLYVAGCLVAGFMVGSVCYVIIKQVLKVNLDRQCQTLSQVAGIDQEQLAAEGSDHLEASMEIQSALMAKVETLVASITGTVVRITPLYRKLSGSSRQMVEGNLEQVEKVNGTVEAARQMNHSFSGMLDDIEQISLRAEDRTSICSEMSASTEAVDDMVQQYNASLLETSASIEEMAGSLRETSTNIEDLAVSTEQTASSVTQISATTSHVRDNAQKTAEYSQRVQHQAKEGLVAMESLSRAMSDIDGASQASFKAIQRLSQHSQKIGSVLDIITEIVEQTNLLSLNASIIAAQAGEKGRSFAVVAEEVRSLAQRTASSTKEISTLVDGIQRDTLEMEQTITQGAEIVAQGVHVSRQTDEALRKIEESAGEASSMVQKIAGATVEQASGTTMISQEAEKNMDRFHQVRQATRAQDRSIQEIVRALAQMKELSLRISQATQEQAKGNRQYLNSVVEDNEKARMLRQEGTQQMELGEKVHSFLEQAARLIDANAAEARRISADVETVTSLSSKLSDELEAFRGEGGQ